MVRPLTSVALTTCLQAITSNQQFSFLAWAVVSHEFGSRKSLPPMSVFLTYPTSLQAVAT